MSLHTRSSAIRAAIGGGLLLAAGLVAIFVLPDASRERDAKRQSAAEARANLVRQMDRLTKLQEDVNLIRKGQEMVAELESGMPKGSVAELQWHLNRALHTLAAEAGIRLQSVRYGSPSREGAKGTDIENLDVEFQIVGVYQQLKKFMHALEGSGLPFGVSAARLEESPEGARQTVTLRAFRRASTQDAVVDGGEA